MALNNLSLDIQFGEIFCLLGQNGAGKTTTINCFMGFIKPTSGEAFINGLNVAHQGIESKRFVAYLPEVVMLYPRLTAVENLDYFSRLAGFRYTSAELKYLLETVGLPMDEINRKTLVDSKGMRQKVGIAIAIARDAAALLLDEPTSMMDPATEQSLIARLKAELRETTLLLVTHRMAMLPLVDRLVVMEQGQIALDAPTPEALKKLGGLRAAPQPAEAAA
jgi:ABC-2 type transport system ATP-binding protein